LTQCLPDRPEAARPYFEALASDDFACVPEDNIWVMAMLYIVPACVQLNDAPRAAVLYRTLQPYADQFGYTTGSFQGGITYHLGVLAMDDRAVRIAAIAIRQDPGIAIDVTNSGTGGDNSFKTLRGMHHTGHRFNFALVS